MWHHLALVAGLRQPFSHRFRALAVLLWSDPDAVQRGREAMARDLEAEEGRLEEDVTLDVPAEETTKKRRGGRRSRGATGRVGSRGSLKSTQSAMWSSALAEDPRVRGMLEAVDAGDASVRELTDLANTLARRGLIRESQVYYGEALRVDPRNADAWMNLGTLQQRSGDHAGATNSLARAIRLDPNIALAHYNLGVSFSKLDRYDDAIEEFKIALLLDPELADPEKNPQVVHNELLLPVQLELYQNNQGAADLPLVPIRERDPGDR